MNIDQRLEAVSMNIKVLAGMQHENGKRFDQVTPNFEIALDAIKRLENIAASHEQRLDDLEGRH